MTLHPRSEQRSRAHLATTALDETGRKVHTLGISGDPCCSENGQGYWPERRHAFHFGEAQLDLKMLSVVEKTLKTLGFGVCFLWISLAQVSRSIKHIKRLPLLVPQLSQHSVAKVPWGSRGWASFGLALAASKESPWVQQCRANAVVKGLSPVVDG